MKTYGYQYLFALNNLEAVGLLKKREKGWVGTADTGSPWPSLRRALRLVNDAVDVRSPADIAYVSSGWVSRRDGYVAFVLSVLGVPCNVDIFGEEHSHYFGILVLHSTGGCCRVLYFVFCGPPSRFSPTSRF